MRESHPEETELEAARKGKDSSRGGVGTWALSPLPAIWEGQESQRPCGKKGVLPSRQIELVGSAGLGLWKHREGDRQENASSGWVRAGPSGMGATEEAGRGRDTAPSPWGIGCGHRAGRRPARLGTGTAPTRPGGPEEILLRDKK